MTDAVTNAKAGGGWRMAEGRGFARSAWFHFFLPPSVFLLCCALAAPAGAAAQLDVSNVERGTPAQYVKVTGRDFSGEAHGDDLHVRIGEIRLESTGKLPAARYSALGIALYQRGKIVRAKWDFDIGGELTSSKPSVTLTRQTFVMPGAGPQCLESRCEVRLQLRMETGSDTAHAEHTDFAALPVTVAKAIVRPAPSRSASAQPTIPRTSAADPLTDWERGVAQAMAALSKERYGEAEQLLKNALALVEKRHGADFPGAARIHFHMAIVYERQKKSAEQERALLGALRVAERHPDAEFRKSAGTTGSAMDKEIIARQLGDYYWEQRRYDRGFEFYDRAYRYARQIQISEGNRNWRLARSSAGRMVTACMLGKWDVADSAMKELKERVVHVDARTRTQLEYWIRTGEPRLAARKC